MRPLPLYDAALLERAKRPVGAGELPEPRHRGRAVNPLCGDEIEVDVRTSDGRVEGVAHRARGCVVVSVSASLLAETVPGLPAAEALAFGASLQGWLAGSEALPPSLAALDALRLFPSRARCALLPWEALVRALAPR